MPRKNSLTQEQFDALLDWLDSNRDVAAHVFEETRQSLVRLFVWRKCTDPEKLADLAMDRVAAKLPGLRETYQGDPVLYFHGVARRLVFEDRRKARLEVELPLVERGSSIEVEDMSAAELRFKCLDQCLEKLSEQNRELILQYYSEEKRAKIDFRLQLAAKTGIDVENLRVKMHRIRASLHKCIESCLDGTAMVQ